MVRGNRLGRRLRVLREGHGWTRAELAERVGVTGSHIGRLEAGNRVGISAALAVQLAALFQVNVDFLLGLSDDPRRLPQVDLDGPDVGLLMRELSFLDKRDRVLVGELVATLRRMADKMEEEQ